MKIMLVDDDDLIRDTLTDILQVIMGHDVTPVGNGREAADLYFKDDYPIIISDIRMPNMSGLEFLNTINKSPKFENTEVIFCTGFPDMNVAIDALRSGADDEAKGNNRQARRKNPK